jgi:uncharacterized protein YlxW (UPF0749 family)
MGLLAYLTAHAVDEDYAVAAQRHDGDSSTSARRRIGLAGALALAVFAVLAVTAAAQTSQDSVAQERERRALIDQVKARKGALATDRASAATLQAENDRLQAALLHNTTSSGGVTAELDLLALRSGTSAVRGPGVEIVADDAPNAESDRNKVLDSDLQKLVNGLWRAGAEAISINGQRLTNLSAIRHAGSAITVNYTSLSRPYRILAIGDRNALPSRFADTTSGQAWLDLQRQVGLRFTMRTQKSLRLPAADVPDLRYAKPAVSPKGKGTP